MTRTVWFGLITVLLAFGMIVGTFALGRDKFKDCWNDHRDNLIGCALAPSVALSVKVSGAVDEVTILRAHDDQVMGKIVTLGQDVTEVVYLPSTHRYYVVIRKGTQTRRSTAHGFETTQTHDRLEVFSLDHWEGPF